MPGRELPQLTAASTLADADLVYATVTASANASRKITVSDLRATLRQRAIARYYMHGNATATPIAVSGTYYPILGTTTSGSAVVGFTQGASNAAVLTGAAGMFYVVAIAAVSGGNNQLVSVRLAVNGTPVTSAEGEASTETGAKRTVVVQDVITLSPGDTLSVQLANTTSTTSITAVDLSLVAHRV